MEIKKDQVVKAMETTNEFNQLVQRAFKVTSGFKPIIVKIPLTKLYDRIYDLIFLDITNDKKQFKYFKYLSNDDDILIKNKWSDIYSTIITITNKYLKDSSIYIQYTNNNKTILTRREDTKTAIIPFQDLFLNNTHIRLSYSVCQQITELIEYFKNTGDIK